MRSSSNPLAEDIRRWAYGPEADEPVQDWDLLLATTDQEDLFMELASDDACPNADYFLAVLYLIVGDAVRSDYRTHMEVSRFKGSEDVLGGEDYIMDLVAQRDSQSGADPDRQRTTRGM